jgi:nitrous oxidase accessory protein NosD
MSTWPAHGLPDWDDDLLAWESHGHEVNGTLRLGLVVVTDPTYGALGNGTANDITAIRAAVAAANSDPNGAVVFFPGGKVYNIQTGGSYEDVFAPGSNVHFVGGPGATLKINAANADGPVMISIGNSDCLVDGLTIDCAGKTSSIGVRITSSSRNTVKNCSFINTVLDVYLQGSSTDTKITNNYFINNVVGYGVLTQDAATSSRVNITSNVFIGSPGYDGVEINTPSALATDWNIVGNVISGYTSGSNSGLGVGIAQVLHVNISGNTIIGCRRGVHIEDNTQYINIVNNNFISNVEEAIYIVNGGGADPADIQISGNLFTGNGTTASGFAVIFSDGPGITRRVLIDGNYFNANGQATNANTRTINGSWSCDLWTVTNNFIASQFGSTAGLGIAIFISSGDSGGIALRAEGNTVFNCAAGVVFAEGAPLVNCLIQNNFFDTVGTGIGSGAAGLTIRNNHGWKTEAKGATTIADGATITHGLVLTPTVVTCTPSVAGEFASVTAKSATTFTVALKKWTGGVLTAGTSQLVYWRADV